MANNLGEAKVILKGWGVTALYKSCRLYDLFSIECMKHYQIEVNINWVENM